MGLEKVTITGADDDVDLDQLLAVHDRYQAYGAVEWAVLYMPEKAGSPRYPTEEWIEDFLQCELEHTAIHLCGSMVFESILNAVKGDRIFESLARFNRVQVNVNARKQEFSDEEVLTIYRKLLDEGLNLILQYHDRTAAVIREFLGTSPGEETLQRVELLMDASQGKGIRPASWPEPLVIDGRPVRCGFAGGLGPDVMTVELPKIDAVSSAHGNFPYFIDMETGVRSGHNRFDLEKVDRALYYSLITMPDEAAIYANHHTRKRAP